MSIHYLPSGIFLLVAALTLTTNALAQDSSTETPVPDNEVKDVVDDAKKPLQQEEREIGQAYGNVRDCEAIGQRFESGEEVEQKDLDKCEIMVK